MVVKCKQALVFTVFAAMCSSTMAMLQNVEHIDVRSEKLESLSKDVMSYSLNREIGMSALHAKDYEAAFRRLSESAKQGDKMSQFYLASMYFKGLGTDIDNKQGWVWLNLALEQRNAEWRYAYEKIAEVIPTDVKTAWQGDVEDYRDKYGAKATQHSCRKEKPLGSNIIEVRCHRVNDGSYDFRQWRDIQNLFLHAGG
ncbi:hypothetical protein [Alteromonas oceanisediminis]|uniref:hypothetical protein n=1 Tax=Alteromonas oceanisediminis TaxID=2836180 RepID=UPI001BD913B5|nr:hypothetical protein [Alteromonas oceanisediminis]MBT0585768.1 hypothetical protein [Alteromonas oceanisediminis]